MKYPKIPLLLFFFMVYSASCSRASNDSYYQEIENWKSSRLERLKSKTGWLNLSGLFWLEEGNNTFGSDSSNTIIFPPNSNSVYGSIFKSGDTLLLAAANDTIIKVDGIAVARMKLQSDFSGVPTLMESGSFAWFIIKRDERYGIRLRNYNHPRIEKLDSIPCFKTSPEWRIEAEYSPFDSMLKIETTNVIGGTELSNCPGEIVFRKGTRKYRLLPFIEGDGLFIIFADKTSGVETYGNGRYLYTVLPDSANKVILDFNKAYNPPCAFSPFATCAMPPRENILDIRILAGEKEIHTE